MALVFGSAVITDSISGGGISATTPILVATTTAGVLGSSFQNNSIVDGITLTTGDRILIKNQASGVENGIYTVNVSGAPTRSIDLLEGSSAAGKVFQIIEGNTNADTSWTITNDPPLDIVGTNALVFVQISRTGVDNLVSGSGSSAIDRIVLWDDTTGTLLKQTNNVSINSNDDVSGINSLRFVGSNVLSILPQTQTVASATAFIPNLSGVNNTFVMTELSQTLTNKTLNSPSINAIINGGTLTLPNATDTLVARATSDTLTNKTITDISNNVNANGLNTTGSPVIINTSIQPTVGQILQATGTTSASWSYRGWRSSVVVASTENVNLALNLVGSTVDGIILTSGDRLLLKNQTNSVENGIYLVNNGAGSTTRSSDMPAGSNASMVYVFVQSGTVGAGLGFLCTNIAGSDIVATNNLSWNAINGSSIGGSTLQVLFNNNGVVGGSSRLLIDAEGFPQITGTINNPTSAANNTTLFADNKLGIPFLGQMNTLGAAALQTAIWNRNIGFMIPVGNSTTVTTIGMLATGTGTATTRNISTATKFTSTRRIGYVSAATAGSTAGVRHTQLQYFRGSSEILGGFFYVARFGFSSAASVSTQRTFVGLIGTGSVIGNVEPSTLTNTLGFAVDSTDTTWYWINRAAGALDKVELIGTFPPRGTSGPLMEARICCPPGSNVVYYSLEVLGGGSLATGTATTNLPASTQLLATQIWTNNAATAAAVAIDISFQYIEFP